MPSSHSADQALTLCSRDPSKILGLTLGTHSITPGQYIPKADAQSAPELTYNPRSPTATYTLICIDIDPPYPSFAIISPILHWNQPNLKIATNEDGAPILKAMQRPVAGYQSPMPPPGSAPHRYVFCLYEQPESFDASKYMPAEGEDYGAYGRIRFDLDGWEKEVGLGAMVASNYFLCN